MGREGVDGKSSSFKGFVLRVAEIGKAAGNSQMGGLILPHVVVLL